MAPVGFVKDSPLVSSVLKYGHDVWKKEGHQYEVGEHEDVIKGTKVGIADDWLLFSERMKLKDQEYEGIPIYRPSIDPKENVSLYPPGTKIGNFIQKEPSEKNVSHALAHHVARGATSYRGNTTSRAAQVVTPTIERTNCHGELAENVDIIIPRTTIRDAPTYTVSDTPAYTIRNAPMYTIPDAPAYTTREYYVDHGADVYCPNTSRVLGTSQSPRIISTSVRTYYADGDTHMYRPQGGRCVGVPHSYRPATSRVYLEGH